MSDPTYLSRIRIERLKDPDRLTYLPAEEEPVGRREPDLRNPVLFVDD